MSNLFSYEGSTVPDHLKKLSYATRSRWKTIERRLERKSLVILAVSVDYEDRVAWKLYIDKKKYESPFSTSQLKSYQDTFQAGEFDHISNIDLRILFSSELDVSKAYWKLLSEQSHAFIMCVSIEEIDSFGTARLSAYLHFQQQILINFPFYDLFRIVSSRSKDHMLMHDHLIDTLWDTFLAFLFCFRSISRLSPASSSMRERPFDFPTPMEFQKLLPSMQFLFILLQYASTEILKIGSKSVLKRYVNVAYEIVRQAIDDGQDALDDLFDANKQKEFQFDVYNMNEQVQQLRHVFTQIVDEDLMMLLYQEAQWSGENEYLTPLFNQLAVDATIEPKSALQLWMARVSNTSINDRIAGLADKHLAADDANIWPESDALVGDDICRRFYYDTEHIEEFKFLFNKLPDKDKQKALRFVKKQWRSQFFILSNTMTYPYFKFVIHEDKLFPQWNLASTKEAEELLNQRAAWEMKQIQAQIEIDQEMNRRKGSELIGRSSLPSRLIYNDQARATIQDYNQAQSVLLAYRTQKKLDYGIRKENRTHEDHSEIWLNEILQIEKEVAPFVIFVKKAFQSALPVRKSVVIDHDRNTQDGVDFDPETMQDPHKWMHGEIMTAFKTKTGRRDAAQINTFVLDASGSMRHARMRNLFKVLVLMVMGLEDRKSFDAFHFFNLDFVEGAKFSDAYTNRSILFRILKRIAKIENNRVSYSGNGGTNMSEGIIQSHDRLQAFQDYLKQKKPRALFLNSLFVITDGRPSVGISNPTELNVLINEIRQEHNAIKGIYFRPEEDVNEQSFMSEIFGAEHCVESTNFEELINQLVSIMTRTYKLQREKLKYQAK